MSEPVARSIERHYTQGKLRERVLTALAGAGLDIGRLRPEDLYAIDQLHGGGLAATREHARRSGITADMRVLDIGCGVGGSARYLAATTGCRVVGVDLTAEFVEVARELSARCGLGDRVTFERADATDLPFAGATFDHVWSHNVTMNIRDKVAFAAEIARVLRPGGRFTCAEYAKGPTGSLTFPLSWAREPSQSFLVTPEEMRVALESGGLRASWSRSRYPKARHRPPSHAQRRRAAASHSPAPSSWARILRCGSATAPRAAATARWSTSSSSRHGADRSINRTLSRRSAKIADVPRRPPSPMGSTP